MEDTRLVRDLLDANLRLTEQVIELARLAIGAPVVTRVQGAPMAVAEPVVAPEAPEFSFDLGAGWEDFPDRPLGPSSEGPEPPERALIYRRPDRDVREDLPLHIDEEEEDLRFQVAMGQAPPAALTDLLARLGAQNHDIELAP